MRLSFEGGTITLHSTNNQPINPQRPPWLVWDSRTQCFRAPAFRLPELQCWLAAHKQPPASNPLKETIIQGPVALPALRPYQAESLCKWVENQRRGMIVLPTGAGKTITAIHAIAHCKVSTLICVPTRILLRQWHNQLSKFFPKVGILGDGHHEVAPITVATFHSAFLHMSRIGNRFNLIVIDEAHHLGTGLRGEVLEMSSARYRLGLTATPPSDPAATDRLRALVGPICHRVRTRDLMGTWLAQLDTQQITVDLTPPEQIRYHELYQRFRSFRAKVRQFTPNWPTFVRMAERSTEGVRALECFHAARRLAYFNESKCTLVGQLLRKFHAHQILIFTADTMAAYAISARFLIPPITAHIIKRERSHYLEEFAAGRFPALVTCRVLNEGYDLPNADIAIVTGGTQGSREHLQRIGRILRPLPGKRAQLFEIISANTIEESHALQRHEFS